MKVYVVTSGARIEPFDCGVGDVPLGAATLADAQRQALRTAGALPAGEALAPAEDDVPLAGPALVLRDDVWVTRRALRGFLPLARGRTQPSRLCLPPSRMLDLTLPLQDVPVDGDGRAAFDVGMIPAGTT